MALPRHLSRPPISEALFDFRVKTKAGLEASTLGEAHGGIAEEFPIVQERRGFQLLVDTSVPQQTNTKDLGLQGFFFRSRDEKSVAQFRIDGFTFNRLSPYTSWEEIFPVAMRLWRHYCEIAQPTAAIRLAARYLNRIPLPRSMQDFEQYLTSPPLVPADLPQQVSSFLTSVTIHDPVTKLSANIGQTLQLIHDEKDVAMLLDVDVYDQRERPCDSLQIEEVFGRLRTLKNRVFFSLITEETVRQFE